MPQAQASHRPGASPAEASPLPPTPSAPAAPRSPPSRLREVAIGLGAGTVLGVALIHTTAAIVVAPPGAPWAEAVVASFDAPQWGFVVYHALVGAAFGAGIGGVLGVSHRRQLAERERAAALERQLHQSQRLESLGRLAGGVAHDFNNLLTAMRTSLFLAGRRLPAGDPARGHLDDAVRVVERASKLPAQLLAFARGQPSAPRVLDPRVLVGDLRRMLERVLGDHIELSMTSAGAGHVAVDPGQLEQVVVNLAVNARDAMPRGGRLELHVADVDLPADGPGGPRAGGSDGPGPGPGVEGGGLPPGPYVAISVADTGTGMPPEVLARLFEPFFTTKPEGKGTGLGLATSYGIVRSHGGDIRVSSILGQGSTFRILLPRVAAQVAPAEAATPGLAGAAVGAGLRVLVVDDQPAVLEGVAAVLAEHGFRVHTARDGGEALAAVRAASEPFDLVLSDVVMPRVDGVALAARLGEERAGVAVLLMSGNPEVLDLARRNEAAILAKPFSPEALVEAVRHHARRGPAPVAGAGSAGSTTRG